jgi:predicted lipid-binding transport protein (Tim44 family)
VIQLLILAGLAALVLFQLFNVLGRHGGTAKDARSVGQSETGHARVLKSDTDKDGVEDEGAAQSGPETEPQHVSVDPQAEEGLRAIEERDPRFDRGQFVAGAVKAYEMIVDAYGRGDINEVRSFLDPEVREAFEGAVRERVENEQTLELEIDAVDEAKIERAKLKGDVARIGVRIEARVFEALKDSENRVVRGDPAQSKSRSELWTFERSVKSSSPNWTLVATGR